MKKFGSKVRTGLVFLCLFYAKCLMAQHFQVLIGEEASGYGHSIEEAISLSDGGTLAILKNGNDRSCIKLDENGELIWRKDYGLNNWIKNLVATYDGGAYLIHHSDISDDDHHIFNVVRLDASGAVLWSNQYSIPSSNGVYWSMDYSGISRSNNGLDVLIAGHNLSTEYNYLLRLDPNGGISWVRITPGMITNIDYQPILLHDNNEGVIVFSNEGYGSPGWLTRIDQAGNTVFSVRPRMTNTTWTYLGSSLAYDADSSIYLFARQDGGTDVYFCLLKFNMNGQLLWYRVVDLNFIPGIDNHVGYVMGDDSIIFGNHVRMLFAPSGELASVEELYTPQHEMGSFTYIESGWNKMLPNGDLISAGSWLREDNTFSYYWSTPLLNRIPWDEDQVCNRELNEYMWNDTLVPEYYTEVVDQPDWVPHTVEVAENPIIVTDLDLPLVTPYCSNLPTNIAEVTKSSIHVAPSLLTANEICNVQLDRHGRLELYDASGRSLPIDEDIRDLHIISTAGLGSGLYLLRAVDTGGSLIGTARIVIH